MNNQINLLPRTDTAAAAKLDRFSLLRYSAIALMSLVVFCAIVLFLLIRFSSLPIMKDNENKLLLSMSRYDVTVAKLFLYTDRLKSIQTIVTKRLPYDDNIAIVSSIIPHDVSITTFKLSGKAVDLTVSSLSLRSLNTLISGITTLTTTHKVGAVTMSSLTYGGDNTYSLALSLTLL